MSTGNITRRGKNSCRLKFDVGEHPETGKRQIHYQTVHGSKAEAQAKLREGLSSVDPEQLPYPDHRPGALTGAFPL
jgi:hypothetical protein